ncbi:hypothetical protein CN918_28310 [Priestia megaterium]|nr:hypothetical protein CN918_28310 [Priestia megaterium]
MKPFSRLSVGSAVVGLLLLGANAMLQTYNDLLVFIGSLFLLVGAILGFIAAVKQEKGRSKFVGIAAFFAVLFVVCVVDPFLVLRWAVWMKN